MASKSVLTPCPRKNPPPLLQQSSLLLFSSSLVWSTLQWDDPFLHNCNTSSSLCACLHPLHWGLTSEHPKPISSSYLPNSPSFFFLQILQLLLFSTSQNLMLSHTTRLASLSFLSDQSRPIFMLMLGRLLSWINPLRRPHCTQKAPSKWQIPTRNLQIIYFLASIWSICRLHESEFLLI